MMRRILVWKIIRSAAASEAVMIDGRTDSQLGGINLTKLTGSSFRKTQTPQPRTRADQTRSASVAAFFDIAPPVGLKGSVLHK